MDLPDQNYYHRDSSSCVVVRPKWREINLVFCWDKPGYYGKNLRLTSNIFLYTRISLKLHKGRILSVQKMFNYEEMVSAWRLNGSCLTKKF